MLDLSRGARQDPAGSSNPWSQEHIAYAVLKFMVSLLFLNKTIFRPAPRTKGRGLLKVTGKTKTDAVVAVAVAVPVSVR